MLTLYCKQTSPLIVLLLQSDINIQPNKLESVDRKWDLWPLDPVTLEMFGRFMFTIAFLCDLWSMNTPDDVLLHLS